MVSCYWYAYISHDLFYSSRDPEYCDRYAKKNHADNSGSDESDEEVSDNEAYSDGRSESEDEVAGHADP